MLRFLILLCILLSAVKSQLLSASATHVPCSTSADCASDECCLSNNQPRGKRAASGHHGTCQKNGTSGSQCYVDELSTGVEGLYFDCPCADGFACQGTGMREVPKGEIGTCETKASLSLSTLGQACSSGADCADTECCVTPDRPIGKRATVGARCTAMGTEGSGCLVKMGSGKPDGVVYSCPCVPTLTCQGSGMIDVPLGEVGVCEP